MARNQLVKTYVTPEEAMKIWQAVDAAGMSISTWVRMVLLRAAELPEITLPVSGQLRNAQESDAETLRTPQRKRSQVLPRIRKRVKR